LVRTVSARIGLQANPHDNDEETAQNQQKVKVTRPGHVCG
ncbi:unnamed protein product, partial [marine sediment metagenome]